MSGGASVGNGANGCLEIVANTVTLTGGTAVASSCITRSRAQLLLVLRGYSEYRPIIASRIVQRRSILDPAIKGNQTLTSFRQSCLERDAGMTNSLRPSKRPRMGWGGWRSDRRGSSFLEFGLLMPIYVLVIGGVIDIGRAISMEFNLSNGVSAAANFAMNQPTITGGGASHVEQRPDLGQQSRQHRRLEQLHGLGERDRRRQ